MCHALPIPILHASPDVTAVVGVGRSSSGQRIGPAGGTAPGPDGPRGGHP